MQHDVEGAHVRSPTPDSLERDACEHTAPVQTDADTAQIGQDLVAEVTAAVKAFVGVAPDTFQFILITILVRFLTI